MELKTPLSQQPSKELVAKIPKIEIPSAPAPAPMMKKMTEREPETPKTTSSEPSLQRSTRKKQKEPSPELSTEEEEEGSSKEEEDVEMVSSNNELGSDEEEEAELATPPLGKKKKIKTRASKQKKSAPVFKTLVSLKRPTKIPKKGESS